MKRVIAIGIPCLAIVALVGWRVVGKQTEAKKLASDQQARKAAPANDEFATAGPRDILQGIDVLGTVQSPQTVKLSPKTAERIQSVEVREGDAVRAGQILVRIDPTEVEAQVVQSEVEVAAARSKLAQAKITQGSNDVGISSQIRQQTAGVATANADYRQTAENLNSTIAAAQSAVSDADARVQSAQATVNSAQADMESAQANQENTAAKLNRVLDLYRQNFIAAQDVDDAKTADKVAKSSVNAAKQKIEVAKSALHSAEAQRRSAQAQLKIVQRKGVADSADAKAKLDQARATYDVAVSNRSQTAAYQENIAALQAGVAAAEGALRQAQARRADTQLASPIEGVVTARAIDPGAIATPGQPILTVEFLKWLYVTAAIPVEQSQSVSVGQTATVVFDALPGQTFTGKISKLNPAADPTSRQFTVYVALANPQGAIRPGMYGRLAVVTRRTKADVVVPREAVKTEGGATVVYTVDQNKVAHRNVVKTGRSDASGIEILSGLKAGDRVIVLSYQPPRDGQKVTSGAGGKS